MIIKTKNLNKTYKDADSTLTVIDSLNIEFQEKSTISILGKSGVGKSTLLHILGTLDKPTSGNLHFDDKDVTVLNDKEISAFRLKNIGFIFQFHNLLPEFNAIENVAMPLLIGKEKKEVAYDKAKEILKLVGLEKRMEHIPSKLSGGEQQRVAIARALINKPSIILGDEPTGSLDVKTSKYIWDLIQDVNKELKNTFILVTHNRELASTHDFVYEMQEGGNLERLK